MLKLTLYLLKDYQNIQMIENHSLMKSKLMMMMTKVILLPEVDRKLTFLFSFGWFLATKGYTWAEKLQSYLQERQSSGFRQSSIENWEWPKSWNLWANRKWKILFSSITFPFIWARRKVTIYSWWGWLHENWSRTSKKNSHYHTTGKKSYK